eukprot:753712-Hanusia_phi.AAC.1
MVEEGLARVSLKLIALRSSTPDAVVERLSGRRVSDRHLVARQEHADAHGEDGSGGGAGGSLSDDQRDSQAACPLITQQFDMTGSRGRLQLQPKRMPVQRCSLAFPSSALMCCSAIRSLVSSLRRLRTSSTASPSRHGSTTPALSSGCSGG